VGTGLAGHLGLLGRRGDRDDLGTAGDGQLDRRDPDATGRPVDQDPLAALDARFDA
jgi:hypothetical protein